MNEEVLAWIEKMSNEYADCKCGRKCHMGVTIGEFYVKFWVYCLGCDRAYDYREHIEILKQAPFDLTDLILEKVRKDFLKSEVAE